MIIINIHKKSPFGFWKKWIRTQPWLFRWFVFLILFRPLIDVFWYLKKTNPFYSPLYIVGVLTPVFIIVSLLVSPRKSNLSNVKILFLTWLIFTTVNTLLLINSFAILTILQIFFKFTLVGFLYLFLKKFIRNKYDFYGLLFTFLLSSIITGIIYLFSFFSPISPEESRGFIRDSSLFADVVSLGIAISLTYLIFYYSFLIKIHIFNIPKILLVIVFLYMILILMKLFHLSSWGVFIYLLFLFLYYLFKGRTLYQFFIITVILTILFFSFQKTLKKDVYRLFKEEAGYIQNPNEISRFGHGRGEKWKLFFEEWNKRPVYQKVLGWGFYNSNVSYWWENDPHNDFLRILLSSGLIGLVCYISILGYFIRKSFKLFTPERFIALGVIGIIIIYSIGLNPMIYPSFLYIAITILVYIEKIPIHNKIKVNRITNDKSSII